MTDRNTAMMREVFLLLSTHESVPDDYDEKYWSSLASGAASIYGKYPSPLTASILTGVIDGQSEIFKRAMAVREASDAMRGQQISMADIGGALGGF